MRKATTGKTKKQRDVGLITDQMAGEGKEVYSKKEKNRGEGRARKVRKLRGGENVINRNRAAAGAKGRAGEKTRKEKKRGQPGGGRNLERNNHRTTGGRDIQGCKK